MKSFCEIIKMETLASGKKASIRNSDMVQFLTDNPGMTAEKLEGIVRSGLSLAGFNVNRPFVAYMSPTNQASMYEQDYDPSEEEDDE